MTRKQDSDIDTQTRQRTPFGGPRRRLYVPEIPGYKLYWFNDVEDRIERAKAAGYSHVLKSEISGEVGDKDVSQTKSLDSTVSKRLRHCTAYLMKIKQEYWDEDRAVKDLQADKIDEAIKVGGSDKVARSYGLDVNYRR